MHRNLKAVFTAALVATSAACSEGAFEPVTPDYRPLMDLEHAGPSYMSNYVAMGTSLSMGWASDGVYGASQATSWTAQLADRLHTTWSFPAIAFPGCKPPYMSPLGSFLRVDGTSAGDSRVCAPNEEGVTLPTQNLAVEYATAREALTGAESPRTGRGPVTSRVLPPGMTQVTAMQSLNPTFVSVEFGGNEILTAQVGLLVPGLTYTPFSVFKASYAPIVQAVKGTEAKALLVSIGTDLRNFPAIRTGPEIAAERAAFAEFNVVVSSNCDESENFLFVRGIVPTALQTAAHYARNNFGPYTLSCADQPGKVDYILTPANIEFVNDLAAQMTAEIEAHAADNGYATFPLGELYDIAKEGVPFDLNAFLNSPTPYGELISLDGVHPSPAGQAVLAKAAAKAIRKTYGQNGNGIGKDPRID